MPKWTKQPPIATPLDRRHPLCPSLSIHAGLDGVRVTTGNGTIDWNETLGDLHRDGFDIGSSAGGGISADPTGFSATTRGSITIWYQETDTVAGFAYIWIIGGTSARFATTTDTLNFSIGGTSAFTGMDAVINDGNPHILTYVYTAENTTADQHLYIDGRLYDTDNAYKSSTSGAVTDIYLGQSSAGFNLLSGANLNSFLYHNRHLSAPEVAELHSNLWQIFKPPRQFVQVDVPTDVRHGVIRKPWTKQPPLGTKIDWSNPLAPKFMFVGGTLAPAGMDVVGGKVADGGGGTLHVDGVEPTSGGEGASFDNQVLRIEEKGSLTFYVRGTGAWASFKYFAHFTGAVDFSARTNTTVDDLLFSLGGNNSFAGTGIDDGLPHIITYVYEATGSAADQQLYIDGVLFATQNTSKTASSGVNTDINIGTASNGFSQTENTVINTVMYHPRRLLAGEVKSLHENEWQIFEPQRTVFAPINEDLPDVAQIEKPSWTRRPPYGVKLQGPLAPNVGYWRMPAGESEMVSELEPRLPYRHWSSHSVLPEGQKGSSSFTSEKNLPTSGSFTCFTAGGPDLSTYDTLVVLTNLAGDEILVRRDAEDVSDQVIDFYTIGNFDKATWKDPNIFDGTPRWYTFTWVQEGVAATNYLYMNGELVAQDATNNSFTANSQLSDVELGNRPGQGNAWDTLSNDFMVHDWVLSPSEVKSLHENPWQIFEPPRIVVPLKESTITVEDTGPAIVEGSISFGITTDKTLAQTLTAEAAATFLVNLAMTPTGEVDSGAVTGEITFGLQVDQTETNTATRPVSFSTTLNLSQLESNVATKLQSMLFALDAAQTQTNVKVTGETLTFTTDLDYAALNQLIAEADVTIASQLSYNILNQLTAESTIDFDTVMDQAQLNQLTAESTIDFDTVMDQAQLNQLAANLSITFASELDYTFLADGAGVVNAAISFLVNLSQAQTKTMTADKAISFLLDVAQQQNVQLDTSEVVSLVLQASDSYTASRDISGDITLGASLEQAQSNALDKVLLMSFNALMDKQFTTAGSTFGTVTSFATTLATNFGTEGDVNGEITFLSNLDQLEQTQKITSASLGLSIEADVITNIHLVARGEISLVSTMQQTEAKQLLGQSEITFGHIAGLAAINSADLGADITMGVIQDVQVNGFTVIFEIITPADRKVKVYVEDRTVLLDAENRVVRINKT